MVLSMSKAGNKVSCFLLLANIALKQYLLPSTSSSSPTHTDTKSFTLLNIIKRNLEKDVAIFLFILT